MMRANLHSALVVAIATLAVGGVLIGVLPSYWIYLATAVLITAVSLLSLGVVEGRTGMISLCQLSFAGVGRHPRDQGLGPVDHAAGNIAGAELG